MPSAPKAISIESQRQPVHPSIDESKIDALVRHFYGRVREDDELGPIFAQAITGDWEPHLQKIMDFWSSVLLKTGRYSGQPMQKHVALEQVRPEHFGLWLTMFEESAQALFEPEVARVFTERAHLIARSLQLGMFGMPGIPNRSADTKKTDPAKSDQPRNANAGK